MNDVDHCGKAELSDVDIGNANDTIIPEHEEASSGSICWTLSKAPESITAKVGGDVLIYVFHLGLLKADNEA